MSDCLQKKIFSKNLNELMFLNGKSQSEVASAIGVSPQTFNTWMQGIAIPRMDKIQLLADYFNVKKSLLIEQGSFTSRTKEKDFNKVFSDNLRYHLEIRNITQVELAHRLGVGTTSVYNWTSGLKTPRMDKIDKICSILRVSRNDLLTESTDDSSDRDIQSRFADNLNELLRLNSKTQLELANYIGVSNTAVNKWTKGCNTPRMDKIDLICSFFHIDRKDLFTSKQSEQNQFTNSKVLRVAQELSTNSELLELFNIAKDSTPEQLNLVADMLRQFRDLSNK